MIRIQRRTVAVVRTDTFRSEPRQRCNGVLLAHLLRSPYGCVCCAVAGFCVSAGVPRRRRFRGRAYRGSSDLRFQTAAAAGTDWKLLPAVTRTTTGWRAVRFSDSDAGTMIRPRACPSRDSDRGRRPPQPSCMNVCDQRSHANVLYAISV